MPRPVFPRRQRLLSSLRPFYDFRSLSLLAQLYLPMLYEEHLTYTPDFYDPAIYAGQVEQETRYGLDSKRCWNPRTELRGFCS